MSKATPVRKTHPAQLFPAIIAKYCQFTAWLISLSVVIIAFIAWGHSYKWQLGGLSTYQIFPLLGLLAFSLMWSHYVASVIRQMLNVGKEVLSSYFEATSFVVLALICLHPGLLIYQRFRDGYGLPPHSYESYVAPGLGWVTLLGTACFILFIAYEFRRLYGSRSWWQYIAIGTDLAMLGIFYHSLRLGGQLQTGWFRLVWIFYGVILVVCLAYIYAKKYQRQRQQIEA